MVNKSMVLVGGLIFSLSLGSNGNAVNHNTDEESNRSSGKTFKGPMDKYFKRVEKKKPQNKALRAKTVCSKTFAKPIPIPHEGTYYDITNIYSKYTKPSHKAWALKHLKY